MRSLVQTVKGQLSLTFGFLAAIIVFLAALSIYDLDRSQTVFGNHVEGINARDLKASELAHAVNTRAMLVRNLILQSDARERKIAAGDLSMGQHAHQPPPHSVLAAVVDMQESLRKLVLATRINAESVSNASGEIAQGNADLSARTESQASALEETAASMEQLGSAVTQNAENANRAKDLAVGASLVAERAGAEVEQVVKTMKAIDAGSRRVADIITVIDSIAFQTNILALNAAVEAARAGEMGRGFAVVASEVRSLAQRSAKAAKEIEALISASVNQVREGSSLADRAGATMQEIVASVAKVRDIMGEISAASTEQSAGVRQVGEAVSQMDQTTQQNAAMVEQMAAAAAGLKSQAEELVRAVRGFNLGDATEVAWSEAPARPAMAASGTLGTPASDASVALLGNRSRAAQWRPKPQAVAAPAGLVRLAVAGR